MKKIDLKMEVIFFLLVLVIPLNLLGQKNEKSSFRLKNIISFYLEENTDVNRNEIRGENYIRSSSTISLDLLTPSVELVNKNGNSHELSFRDFLIQKKEEKVIREDIIPGVIGPSSHLTRKIFNINMNYVYNLSIYNINTVVEFYLGVGVNPWMILTQIEPQNLLTHPWHKNKTSKIGINAFLNPKANFFISKKYFLEFSIPFTIYHYEKSSNPILGGPQYPNLGRIKYSKSQFLPSRVVLSIGIGVRL